MEINFPSVEADAIHLADWIELEVLANDFSSFRLSDLSQYSDDSLDTENSDIGDQDNKNQIFEDKILEEIQVRINLLKENYPFRMSEDKQELVRRDDPNEGCYVYLYCLFMSNIVLGHVLVGVAAPTNDERDLMQTCSTLAAAGFLNGNSISFGFPRKDKTGFKQALTDAFERIKEGIVRDVFLPGTPANVKDAQVDVIAWSNQIDNGPGRLYLLGQVASGQNWDSKSIKGALEPFHDIFFSKRPPSTPIPAMFMPFCLEVGNGTSLSQLLEIKCPEFGVVFYRYRMPYFAQIGVKLADDPNHNFYVERRNDFHEVVAYVDSQIEQLSLG